MPEKSISEKAIEIKMQNGDGISDSVFFHPEGEGSWPGVLYLTDIGGIRPSNRESAGRLAQQGYAVLMPNIFYRTGRAPLQPSIRTLDDEGRKKRMAELSAPLTPEAMERDASIYIDILTSQNSTRSGMIGVVGHCFSGKMAMYAAAARPDKVGVVASFHGGGLYADSTTSPHLTLPRIKAQLYFGHAVQDRSMPQEAIAHFEQALERWGGKYESETYEGAFHSWTSTDSPVYNQPQAERAFSKLTQLLQESLSS
jgi:carboxymethylenebutenolidase